MFAPKTKNTEFIIYDEMEYYDSPIMAVADYAVAESASNEVIFFYIFYSSFFAGIERNYHFFEIRPETFQRDWLLSSFGLS